jgi:anti-sigma regulatory factor (Ser/Thr protein kinase)
MTVTLVGPVASPGRETHASPLPAGSRPGLRGQRWALVLDAGIAAPSCARAAVAAKLTAWGLPHLVDDATQIASELIANAVAASTQGAPEGAEPVSVTLTLTISSTRRELCVRVWDPAPALPPRIRQEPGTWAERGRGLLIVEELSTRWGCYPGRTGKYVWSVLPIS